jgi:putative spermidine/putrescine transport system substrate-binding protein
MMVIRQRVVAGLAVALFSAAMPELFPAAAQSPSNSEAFDWLNDDQPARKRPPQPSTPPESRPAPPENTDPPTAEAPPRSEQNPGAAATTAEPAPQPDALPRNESPSTVTAPPENQQPADTADTAPAAPAVASPSPAEASPSSPEPSQAQTAPAETLPASAQSEVAPPPSQPMESDRAVTESEPAPPIQEAAPAVSAPPQQAAEAPVDPKTVKLNIATWAGAYGQAQERSIIRPFSEKSGYQLGTITYDGDYEALKRQGDEPKWSVVDLNGDVLAKACDEQRLERLDPAFLATGDNASPADDFLPGAIHPCGIASVAWSAVIVYDNRLSTAPSAIADFFDSRKIPGKRLLPRQPRYSLELALLADGVAPDQVYATLRTPAGQDRAFAKLSAIKDDIVWWDKPTEVFERIANGEVTMGLGFNGRAFMAIMADKHPLAILWDGQIYAYDYWAIPRGARFQNAAREFIRFATSPKQLADQAGWLPYGPARRSALALVVPHPELNVDMKPYLPTFEQNFRSALPFDGAFWKENEASLSDRFGDWIKGRQLPAQRQVTISQ